MSETKTPTPFVCDNCDYRPTIEEVLHHNGDCPKCHDTISVFTVDAAHQLTTALDARKTAEKRAEDNAKACAEMRDWKAMVFTRLEHHCSDNNHHVRIPIEDWNAMPSFAAGRDYVPASQLDEARKALEGFNPLKQVCDLIVSAAWNLSEADMSGNSYRSGKSQIAEATKHVKPLLEALAAAEKVTKQ